jgi:hypothetical protein
MRVLIVIFLTLSLIGCATESQLKAPCDYQGHFCGKKIRINY